MAHQSLRKLLAGGDRRSIADSARARALIAKAPSRVAELAGLAEDDDPLVVMRVFDLLEKFAHEHPEWIEPHKQLFIGRHAESDRWETRLQIVRASRSESKTLQARARAIRKRLSL